ncbi:MAG: molybdopterin molybdotransferase MoeA [Gammaproteobacteria bacterium]|nr:molybdopterin molybdotransferase MoeA [Gammaproteobacteria bacterium]
MITYEQALSSVLETLTPLPATTQPLADALGRVAASDLFTEQAVPPFSNSAMDGFALRSVDSPAAGATVELEVTDLLTAGEAGSDLHVGPGGCCEIMTGAPVPDGCDAVIPVEQVEIHRATDGRPVSITLDQHVAAGRNLRMAGEDFAAGDQLLATGQLVTAERVMGLAATGISHVEVHGKPRAAVITTGNELSDSPKLSPGMINDANGPYLQSAVASFGADLDGVYRTGDDATRLIEKIESLTGNDIIITTGGVSAGRMDFVPAALEQLGADILFHKVAIRPGKPALFARLPDGRVVFGLPGNPIAVAVGMRFFVVPGIRRLRGLPQERYATARLIDSHHKKSGLTFFAKSYAETTANGEMTVQILPGQQSFKIKPLMRANCWAIAGADSENLQADTVLRIAPLGAD